MDEIYNKDYFENGISTGTSCYENYRWMPELTYPMAYAIATELNIKNNDNILEFGCAHGFLVKALYDFGINAYGVDISNFAIENSHPDICSRLQVLNDSIIEIVLNKFNCSSFEWVIAKDVFEHINVNDLSKILNQVKTITKKLFVIVPLGDNGKYRVPAYHLDSTHLLAEDEDWWGRLFSENGFKIMEFTHTIQGIKDKWNIINPIGNGFFKLEATTI
jgi:predicted TPR repeat methyltransferase